MKRVKPMVLSVLRQQPESRDDDVLLAFAVWEREGLHLNNEQKRLLHDLSKPGSLVRVRAHIQNVEQRFKPLHRGN